MAASEQTTAPCPQCLEATELTALECPFCGSNLRLDVIAPAVSEERDRYRIARTLANLGAPLPAFLVIQEALRPPGGVLAGPVSRTEAGTILDRLQGQQLEGRTRPTQGARPGPAASRPAAGRPVPARGSSKQLPRWVVLGGAVLGALVLVALVGRAVTRSRRPPVLPYAELAERGRRSTVVLTSGPCLGSGFFVTPELLLTNAHVVCGSEVEAHVGNARRRATVLNIDEEIDLALLQAVGADGTPLPIGDAMGVREGDLVVAAGAPLGNEGTVVKGAVTQPSTKVWGVLHIESTAGLNPGNSGGPLLNDRGEAVGVISKSKTEGERRWALALPVNYVASWLPPGLAVQGEGWEARVDEAGRELEKDVQRFQSALQRPMLLGAHFIQLIIDPATRGYGAGRLLFVVAAPSSFRGQEPTELTVRMSCGDPERKVTTMAPWLSLDTPLERSPKLSVSQLRPFLAWARKRSLGPRLVVGSGEAMVGYPNGCQVRGLELLDGDAIVDKIPID